MKSGKLLGKLTFLSVGSGLVLASYSKILEACKVDSLFVGTDINTHAIELTKKMFELNKCTSSVQLIETNLMEGLALSFDVIIFNPPYVATDSHELQHAQTTKGIEASYAGGKHGVEILQKFMP